MATGVGVSDEVVSQFNDFKLQRAPHNHRYYIYRIEDKSTVVIDSFGERSNTYNDMVEALPADECRYCLVDLEFSTEDGRATSKLVFIAWCPDTSSIREKMLYAGSKEALKSALVGVGIHINATDFSEIALDTVMPTVMKFA
jgi:cofilin